MTDDTADTVLERKVRAQRKARGDGALLVSRALGRGLSIAADALWGLALVAARSSDDTMKVDRALAQVGDDALLIIIENDQDPCGLVALDREIVTGLIEVQTLGKVTRFPSDDRAFTPTDAAMIAPLLDAALPRFASLLAGQPELAHLQGYRFGALVEDVQIAGLALEGEAYRVSAFDIALAQETRTGRAVFLFPDPPKPEREDKTPSAGKHATTLQLVPARMQAVLTRIHLPLDKAQALKPGDVLPISTQAVSSAALVVAGGHVAARGKLGQMNGFRAVRIGTEPVHTPISDPGPEPPDSPSPLTEQVSQQGEPQPVTEFSFDAALDEIATGLPATIQTVDP